MTKIGLLAHVAAEGFFDLMPIVNAIVGLMIVGYILNRLFWHETDYKPIERLGMALTAGGMVLATPALWMVGTPFDSWSYNVGRIGIAVYIISGGMRRDRHARINAEAVRRAREHLEERRK